MTQLMRTIIILAGIAGGCFFGYLGYLLYIHGVESSTKAGVEWNDISFWFNGAGPGALFGIVGAAAILVAICRPFTEEVDEEHTADPQQPNSLLSFRRRRTLRGGKKNAG